MNLEKHSELVIVMGSNDSQDKSIQTWLWYMNSQWKL